jgi:hypothetical protein
MDFKKIKLLMATLSCLFGFTQGFSQCDPDQQLPTNCLCIFLCHSTATANNNCGVTLTWTTGYEDYGYYFVIRRSPSSGTGYTSIATVQAIGDLTGHSYTYVDNNPPNSDGGNILYYIEMHSWDNSIISQTPVRSASPTCAAPNSCYGTTTTTNLEGTAGNVIVLRLSFGGSVNWNGISNGAGATIYINCAGQIGTSASQHYYGSGYFSLSTDITITMPANTTSITTIATVNNSSSMYSSTATLSIISVNGVSQTTQAVVCAGNSQGYW